MSNSRVTRIAPKTTALTPRPGSTGRRQQPHGERGAEHFQRQDRAGHPVVQGGDPDRVHVDRLVQALDVEPGRAVDRGGVERLSAEPPQLPEEHVALRDDLSGGRAVGHGARQRDPRVGVPLQQVEGAAPHGLGERLRAQVGGADRVRLVDDRRTARLVAPHGQRQAEREDEPHDAEQRGLEDAEGLPQILLEVAERRPTATPSAVAPSTTANRMMPSAQLLNRKNNVRPPSGIGPGDPT